MEGTTIGPYRITGLLGKGGMGEVYRARDTRLDRDVAIKVLPANLTADAGRLARFEREARLLASLNHPKISAVYGLEQVDDRRFLILELVPGDDLSERIAAGGLTTDEAIGIAMQIAEGLQAAHAKSVVHRDLKPSNIKILPDGMVKILDFGLAKALDSDPKPQTSVDDSPTLTHQVTSAGVLLGTAGYASPEQAKGQVVDERTDVWAFGCVLYEMLTGDPVFTGDTVTDVVAAVVTREPDWNRLPRDLPPSLRRLLRRCLTKDRYQRLQHIGDARLELQDAQTAGVDEAPVDRGGPERIRLTLIALGALALGALGMWALGWGESAAPERPRAFSIQLEHPLKEDGLSARAFDISPDGSLLAYSGRTASQSHLYLRRMDEWSVERIPGTEGAGDPVFSPDGQWIIFISGGQLFKAPLGGGKPVLLCNAPGIPYGMDWSSDGTIILSTSVSFGFYRVSDQGGPPEEVKITDRRGLFRWPQILPGNATVLGTLYDTQSTEGTREIVAVDVHGGEMKTLMPGASPSYVPGAGLLLHRQGAATLAVPFDPRQLKITGPAVALPFDVGEWLGAVQLAASDAGDLVYLAQELPSTHQLVWLDREGRSRPAIADRGDFFAPRVSPDGTRLLWSSAISPLADVWVHDLRSGHSSRLTTEGFDVYATWFNDERRIVYSTDSRGDFDLFVKPADRMGDEQRLLETPEVDIPISVAPDGTIFFYKVAAASQRDIMVLKPDGSVEALIAERHNERAPSVSPDGHWFAYVSDESGSDEIYVQPYPTTGQRWQISWNGGAEPRWAPDGSAIYFRSDDALMEAPVKLRPVFSSDQPRELFRGSFVLDGFGNPNYDVAPDGKRFLMVQGKPAAPARLRVALNWFGAR